MLPLSLLPSSTPAECTPPKNPAVVVVVANLTAREFRGHFPTKQFKG
jgi:hypothetical protein